MRTNAIDSTAFRCLQEYSNLIFIYSKVYGKNYDYYIKEYLEELINFNTLKQIRDKHVERIDFIKNKIKNKINIGCPYRQSVVDENIKTDNSTQTDNIIIDTAGNNLF